LGQCFKHELFKPFLLQQKALGEKCLRLTFSLQLEAKTKGLCAEGAVFGKAFAEAKGLIGVNNYVFSGDDEAIAC